MTNTRTFLGVVCWMTVPAMMAFSTFEPVEAATPCAAPRMMVGQVCINLATGDPAADCKPVLA